MCSLRIIFNEAKSNGIFSVICYSFCRLISLKLFPYQYENCLFTTFHRLMMYFFLFLLKNFDDLHALSLDEGSSSPSRRLPMCFFCERVGNFTHKFPSSACPRHFDLIHSRKNIQHQPSIAFFHPFYPPSTQLVFRQQAARVERKFM